MVGHSATARSAVSLSGTMLPAAEGAVAGDQHLRLGVLDAVAERVGGEAPEDHGVGGADARAREERHRQLRHHAEVDVDPVALLDAEGLQRVGELGDVVQELGVGDGAGVAGLALPVVGDLVAPPGVDVPVEAVVGRVQASADEPLRERQVPLEDGVPGLEPVEELAGLLRPEPLEVGLGLGVDRGVREQGGGGELGGRWVGAVLREERRDRVGLLHLVGHHPTPSSTVDSVAPSRPPGTAPLHLPL